MSDKQHRLAKQYRELRQFPSIDEAQNAVKEWQRQLWRLPTFWLGLIGYACVVATTVAGLLIGIRYWFDIPKSMYGWLIGGIAGGSGVAAMEWFWRRRFRKFLRKKLVSYGVPVCLKCGYDLRGQMEPRCPECGTQFDPGLISVNEEHLA